MHMVSKRDLNSAELGTMRTSKSPTTVMTANGEVQTREEATAYVNELDLFVTVVLLFVNGIHPAPDIHEHFMIHKGYGTMRTSSRTTSTILSAL